MADARADHHHGEGPDQPSARVDGSPAGQGATGTTASTGKFKTWPHLGRHDDRLRIQVKGWRPVYVSAWFDPVCPQCRRAGGNAVRSAKGDSGARHCTDCRVRWTADITQPFCSAHGTPEAVLSGLIAGLVCGDGREFTERSLAYEESLEARMRGEKLS